MRVFVFRRKDDVGGTIAFPESQIKTITAQSDEASYLFRINGIMVEGNSDEFISDLRNPCGAPEEPPVKADAQ